MNTFTIDQKSIEVVSAGQLDLEGFVTELKLPASTEKTLCVAENNHGYVLSRSFQLADGLLTVSLQQDGPLSSQDNEVRVESFSRLLRCAMLIFTGRTRSIPISWRPFHNKNRVAIQADRKVRSGGKTNAGRIVLEVTQEAGPRIYAFALDKSGTHELGSCEPDIRLLKSSYDTLANVLTQAATSEPAMQRADQLGELIMLESSLVNASVPHLSLDDWYSRRLTASQRKFVDHPLSTSVRLVGPAGSGKTVALVVKCLRELTRSETEAPSKRILFLSHASSSATAVEELILEMEPAAGLNLLASDPPQLVVTTVYAMANRHMRYDLDELTPVALDGYEGRSFQADVLNELIEAELRADWIAYRSRCSEPFVKYMQAAKDSAERRFFLWELLNEFACVLDAEGVRSGIDRREKYLGDKRRAWMMLLQSRAEREVVLRLYDRFGGWLRDSRAIGSDQMIADFLNYLDSYRWEATREKEGFDAVFVDELHLFNRQERMLFKQLLRDPSAPPAVFVAYDAKQSPRDTFLGLPTAQAQQYDLWKDARLGKTEKIELVDVFRYSPQIARALAAIDRSFPGQDLDSDWPAYSGIAKTEDGPVPTVCVLPSTIATYGIVFKRALAIQQRYGTDRRVAVLCCSYDLFKQYLSYAALRDTFRPITSRDEAIGIAHSRKKFIFSMPEYVAGLQYDTVLLIDVNRGEVPSGPFSVPALRKFVSQVYLGASRAERRLEIFASDEHGGMAPLLSVAVHENVVERVDPDTLSPK